MAANLAHISLTDGPGQYLLHSDGSITIVKGYNKDGQKVSWGPQAIQMIRNLMRMPGQSALVATVLTPAMMQVINNTPDLPAPVDAPNAGLPQTNAQIEQSLPAWWQSPWLWAGIGVTLLGGGLAVWALWPDGEDEWM